MTNSFCALLSQDILIHEIQPRLDVTSLGAWRRSEKQVAALIPAPPPTEKKWERFGYHGHVCPYHREEKFVRFLRVMAQAIHDDHLGVFRHEWPKYSRWIWGSKIGKDRQDMHHIYPLLVASSGGAQTVFGLLHKEMLDHKVDIIALRPLFLSCALFHGRLDFIRVTLGRTREEICSHVLGRWIVRTRYTKGREYLIRDLMAHGQWDIVQEVYALFKTEDYKDFPGFKKLLLQSSIVYGFIPVLDDYTHEWTPQNIIIAFDCGMTSTTALDWFHVHRRDCLEAPTVKRRVKYGKAVNFPPIKAWFEEQKLI